MTRYSYDGDGYITQIVNPQGSVTKLQWGGLHKLVGRTNANGDRVALRYNYEGELLEIHNEADEVHRLERDVVGMLVGETTFDGRSFSYQNDGLGRVIRTVDNAEETTEVVYDAAGRIVQQLFHDGSAREYQYDWCGRITSAENNSSKVIFQRDKLGRIVREQITANGTSHWVEAQLDADGFRCARKTSLGHEEKIDRNAYGGRLRTIVDGSQVIGHERDELGREVSRALPQGGKLINEYDAMSRLTRRAALAPGVTAQPVTDEPEWLGKRAIDETHELKFRYGWDGELVARDDSHRGRSEYRYDPVGHLLACVPEQAKEQLFQYDSRGNRFETTAGSEAREYWAGNRVVRKGNTEYQWDAVGRLVEKRQPASDGSGEAVWRLDWNCEGQLTKAYLPDGTAVEYSYDAFSRRVGKKVVSTTSDGQRETETVSFVWDGNHIAHDIRVAARAAGDPIVEERTFGFTDNQFEPLYQTNAPEDSTSPARTVHYLNDQVGAVDCLIASGLALEPRGVSPKRELVGRPRLSACKASTSMRKPAFTTTGTATTTPIPEPSSRQTRSGSTPAITTISTRPIRSNGSTHSGSSRRR